MQVELQFKEYFKKDFKDFTHPLLGFDIVSFDEQVIKPSDSESCSQAITRQYGKEAEKLIRKILETEGHNGL